MLYVRHLGYLKAQDMSERKQEIEKIFDELCVIACCYRHAMIDNDFEDAKKFIQEYHECVEQLYATKWTPDNDGYVHIECLLPDEHMPKKFFDDLEVSTNSMYNMVAESAEQYYRKRFPKNQFPEYYPPNLLERILKRLWKWLF
jgi:hypothetical protein